MKVRRRALQPIQGVGAGVALRRRAFKHYIVMFETLASPVPAPARIAPSLDLRREFVIELPNDGLKNPPRAAGDALEINRGRRVLALRRAYDAERRFFRGLGLCDEDSQRLAGTLACAAWERVRGAEEETNSLLQAVGFVTA